MMEERLKIFWAQKYCKMLQMYIVGFDKVLILRQGERMLLEPLQTRAQRKTFSFQLFFANEINVTGPPCLYLTKNYGKKSLASWREKKTTARLYFQIT